MPNAAGDFSRIGRRVVVATHRRSGTHLALDLLRRHFPACRAHKRLFEGLDTLYLNLDALNPPWELDPTNAAQRLRRAARPLVKTHADPSFAGFGGAARAFAEAVLREADIIAVHRDVRDVLTSLHHYRRSYAPHQRESVSAFLRQKAGGVSRPQAWADQVRGWRERAALSIAYEEIVANPAEVLARLAARLKLAPAGVEPLLPVPLQGRWQARFMVAFSRCPPATNVPGAVGRPARWREVFSRADRAFIAQEAGELLIELGYEDSDDWVEDAPEELSVAQ